MVFTGATGRRNPTESWLRQRVLQIPEIQKMLMPDILNIQTTSQRATTAKAM